MDAYETLFDLQEQSHLSFATPTQLVEEGCPLPASAGVGNLQRSCYIDAELEDSSCDEEHVPRDQKLINFDENEISYFDQVLSNGDELSKFMDHHLPKEGGDEYDGIHLLREDDFIQRQPRSLFEEEEEDERRSSKEVFIVVNKLPGSKYSLKEVIGHCDQCQTRKEIAQNLDKFQCCGKKRALKEKTKLYEDDLSSSKEGSRTSSHVGLLSIEERSIKVNRYLEKKRRRKWSKKINYQSRKKVAETRFRIKGRFVSADQVDEFKKKHQEELQEKLRKERMFVTQKVDKSSGTILKTVYPNIEALNNDMEHWNTSDNDSHKSCYNLKHNNEVITYIGEVPIEL
ncbi:unnamed protein product [Moneuplotes crassus]|uniref:CCT domain-containing protein n=1 Tax=Euplotes crassus TaxID=5936 RepID=A0AAD2D9U5_EUPCR|nr:unnamed protein product [Moneuplotes crassus]